MSRTRLPNRRQHEVLVFEYAGSEFIARLTVTARQALAYVLSCLGRVRPTETHCLKSAGSGSCIRNEVPIIVVSMRGRS
jgi:hypothetical protein